MKLVCIGDSLTYGYGVSSKSCWTELLKKHLNMEVINKGPLPGFFPDPIKI